MLPCLKVARCVGCTRDWGVPRHAVRSRRNYPSRASSNRPHARRHDLVHPYSLLRHERLPIRGPEQTPVMGIRNPDQVVQRQALGVDLARDDIEP